MNIPRPVRTFLMFPLAAFVCFLTSYLVAKILLALNNNFGSGDTSAFIYWTAIFSGALLLPTAAFVLLLRRVRTINRLWIGFLLGGLAGFGWTLFNAWSLGPWFGAWSFNVLYCWIIGGSLGIVAVAAFGGSSRRALP